MIFSTSSNKLIERLCRRVKSKIIEGSFLAWLSCGKLTCRWWEKKSVTWWESNTHDQKTSHRLHQRSTTQTNAYELLVFMEVKRTSFSTWLHISVIALNMLPYPVGSTNDWLNPAYVLFSISRKLFCKVLYLCTCKYCGVSEPLAVT